MHRFLVALAIACLGLPLIAADSALSLKPTVIVYPFTANGSTIDREATSRLATIIATQMANTGRVRVIPPPPGTERKDFLSVARTQGADYYIAGFISSLGNGVSVVEQVVSTTSGIVISSSTTQLTTYADAAGQGDDLATIVSRHANRGLASIGTPPPAAAATAAPSAQEQANLTRLFSRRKRAASPAPSAAPTAVPASVLLTASPHPTAAAMVVAIPAATSAPSPVAAPAPKATASSSPSPKPATATPQPAATPVSAVVVVLIGGTADTALREAATTRVSTQAHAERVGSASTACAAHSRTAVLSGSLALRADATYGIASATFELVAKDCDGKLLWSRGFSNDAGGAESAQTAMERVVDAAVAAYLKGYKPARG